MMDSVCKVLGIVFKLYGSVLPRTMLFAVPCAAAATLLRILKQRDLLHNYFGELDILQEKAAYTGFTSALALLLIFRTSESYTGYWEGITLGHRMFAEWHGFTSSIIAFTRTSKADVEKIKVFRQRLICLVSIMHATSLASLRMMECTNLEMIDPEGMQKEALEASNVTELPTTLIGQWLLELVMDAIDEGVVQAPPPITSRAFQMFSNGMVSFHDSMKLTLPFPFPYSQITATMLLMHLFVTPFMMCTWVLWPTWVFVVTCLVTMVFWSLYFTAIDIENPFQPGNSRSQYEATRVQKEFNSCLLLLLSQEARSIPELTGQAVLEPTELRRKRIVMSINVPSTPHAAEEDDLSPKMSSRFSTSSC